MQPAILHRPTPRGRTLLELLVVIVIIAVLALLTVQGLNFYRKRAEDVVCMGNLRALHGGMGSYLNDHDQVWPQDPDFGSEDQSDSDAVKFMYEALKPYGPNRNTWLCPSDRQGTDKDTGTGVDEYDASYTPTYFDAERGIAYKYANQPWFIERGGFHGKGEVNMVMPDATIQKRQF